jgi:LmbE family N-acetylglucosaminyl deacetylase
MKFTSPCAEMHVPDGTAAAPACRRITHLGIGAHQDDLEFMAFHGILECFPHEGDSFFGGVVCTDGAGSVRSGPYARCSPEELRLLRREEQKAAASAGRYGLLIQLGYASGTLEGPGLAALRRDLRHVLEATRPSVVYTHNPADRHDTHVAVCLAAIGAMRDMPLHHRPAHVIGCEVWRGLDWLPDGAKVVMDVSERGNLAAALSGLFDSQITGGKRYDLAVAGRRAANATFFDARSADHAEGLIFGMDLAPLVADSSCDAADYAAGFAEDLADDIRRRIRRFSSV